MLNSTIIVTVKSQQYRIVCSRRTLSFLACESRATLPDLLEKKKKKEKSYLFR